MEDQHFLESDWDYCLVLDACRYDVFSEVYDDYLDGTLEKRWSVGSSTPEWAYRTFQDDHDIAYFSGNPFINDLGIPLNELKWGASCDYEWTASDHISDIHDVWKSGWDDDLGTVPPDSLAEAYYDNQDAVERADRTVLHYMQPHAPYLSRGKGQKLKQIQKGIRKQEEAEKGEGDAGGGALSSLGDTIRPKVEDKLDGSELAQKAGLWLELDPADLVKNGTREAALELYEENLRIALESVAELIPELDGTVIVTADHGEAFGEEGVWEHHIETHIPPLMEVPWLEVS
ncbi:hypothetical protein C488_06028 [Natrinema pellirubrum DSM 15624]|uniref:Arylsulfatase A family protein n=1 Tax=Natrinema pellirubrum (strain DSM 15624 / CIP 106293 / JCM 10476 / NCIMB 786 / 157) TaxID=797303 RepID=L0JKD3_NATP1|nr:hypothetical protein [Natrinema pellirubrum]AGB32000.1 hypothetical protein Natpe_2175 [Natrinema pellirubrum DSM 15624]ELY78133.1 hypothetical protein C488_06028 [Natrinema pellirubrum DSM 15624]